MKKTTLFLSLLILLVLVLQYSSLSVSAARQDDEEGHTYEFSPYLYDIETVFFNTLIPYGASEVTPV